MKFCRTKDCAKVLKAKNDLRKFDSTNLDISQRGLRFLLTKVCALTIVCFSQQAKNYMVKAEYLVAMFQTGQLR